MPFFLKNCLKLKKKKNRKKPKIKDTVQPLRDKTDEVTAEEIWPDCRASVSAVIEHEHEEIGTRVQSNETKTNGSLGNNEGTANEIVKAIVEISVAVVTEEKEIAEMDRKSDGVLPIENVKSLDVQSEGSVELQINEQQDDHKSEDEAASNSILEISERRDSIFSLHSEPSDECTVSSEKNVEIISQILAEIDPHQGKISGVSMLKEKEKDAQNDSIDKSLGPELQDGALEDGDVGFTEKNPESIEIGENKSTLSATKEIAKIINGVNAASNVFEKIEELRRLQCAIDEKRQNQMKGDSQNTDHIKDAEISGMVNKDEFSGEINADCEGDEILLDSSAGETKRRESKDDLGDFKDAEFHSANEHLTCDNLSKSHATDIGESMKSFSGDYSFEIRTEKEIEQSECENIAEWTAFVQNIGNENEENKTCSKINQSSCSQSIFNKSDVEEDVVSNAAEFNKKTEEETSKPFLIQICTSYMNLDNSFEAKDNLSDMNLKMHYDKTFSETDILETRDSFGIKYNNEKQKWSESLNFEDTENNFDRLGTEIQNVDLIEDNGISARDSKTNELPCKWSAYESMFSGEDNLSSSEDHTNDKIKRSNFKKKVDGDFIAYNDKPNDTLPRNHLRKEDHGSGDYTKKETVNEDKNELELQNREESNNKNIKKGVADMSAVKNIETPQTYASIEIIPELEKKSSTSLHLEEISSHVIGKINGNDMEKISNISGESEDLSSSDNCTKLCIVIDQKVEDDEIRVSKDLENVISIEQCTDSKNNLLCNGLKENDASFTQDFNESDIEHLLENEAFDINTASKSRSKEKPSSFESQSEDNSQCCSFLGQFSSIPTSSFVIQVNSNVGEHSSASLLSESSINNFATNDSTYDDATNRDYGFDFFQYNEKDRIFEASSSENSPKDLKNICLPTNVSCSGKKAEMVDARKENFANGLILNQTEVNDVEKFKYPVLELFDDNTYIPSKDGLFRENLINKNNKNSVSSERCFDFNPMFNTKNSKKCNLNSLILEPSSPGLLLESGDENSEGKCSKNITLFADGDIWDKEKMTETCKDAHIDCEKRRESHSALPNARYEIQKNPLITINILPRHSFKSRKTRREDESSIAKTTPIHHQNKRSSDILQGFPKGIPENVLDEIEIRRRESLDAFNKKKKEALSDMKPTTRKIPITRSRSSATNSHLRRSPAVQTSPILYRGMEKSLEAPTSPFQCPGKRKIANGDGNVPHPFPRLKKDDTNGFNELLHEVSSQASERMTPVRKRILDASREIRSRKYPVRIDGKTYVINARNHKNPYNLKPLERIAFLPKDKKSRSKTKECGKFSPVRGEFKVHSPEKIERLPTGRQKKPDDLKISQDYTQMKFDYAFRRYAGRGRLDSDRISCKRSGEWLSDAGIVGKILTDDEANDAFRCYSGMKLTLNKGDYRQYIRKLARLKRINCDEIYEKLCSVVAKKNYAAREIMY